MHSYVDIDSSQEKVDSKVNNGRERTLLIRSWFPVVFKKVNVKHVDYLHKMKRSCLYFIKALDVN